MKYILVLLLAVSFSIVKAQSKPLKDFNSSGIAMLMEFDHYGIGKCNFDMITLKIEVNALTVKNIALSDNADSLFRKEITLGLEKLDTKHLITYLKEKQIPKATFLVQLSYSSIGTGCPKIGLDEKQLASLNRFNGKPFSGPCIWLEPIGVNVKRSH